MERSPIEDLAKVAKDVAYVSVGLGVIAFQRLQVRRQELEAALGGEGDDATSALDAVGTVLVERWKVLEERLGAALDHR